MPVLRLVLAGLLVFGATADPKLDNVDAFGDAALPAPAPALPLLAGGLTRGRIAHVEERLGVPTFFWATNDPGAPKLRQTGFSPERAARRHLSDHAWLYRIAAPELSESPLNHLHDTGRGAVIAAFRKEVSGVRVFRDEIKVIMTQDLRLVAISGYLSPHGWSEAKAPFELGYEAAIAAAHVDLTGRPLDVVATPRTVGSWRTFAARGAGSPVRARKVLFGFPDRLEPAYQLELVVAPDDTPSSRYFASVVSAVDGAVLFRKDLTANDSFAHTR